MEGSLIYIFKRKGAKQITEKVGIFYVNKKRECVYMMYVYTHLACVYVFLEWFICCREGREGDQEKSERLFAVYPFVCFEVQTM